MSTDFISPEILVRLIRLYGCLDFSQIARFACPHAWESKPARRAIRKFTAAALREALDDGDIRTYRFQIWPPECNWGVLWDSEVHTQTFRSDLMQNRVDAAIAYGIEATWRDATNRRYVDVYFGSENYRALVGLPQNQISARLILREFFWSRVAVDANVRWVTCQDAYLISEGNFDGREFPYLRYWDGEQSRVVVSPAPKHEGGDFIRDLQRFRAICASLGFPCQVLSPRPPKGLWTDSLDYLNSVAGQCEIERRVP